MQAWRLPKRPEGDKKGCNLSAKAFGFYFQGSEEELNFELGSDVVTFYL